MTTEHKPQNVPPHIQRGVEAIRENSLCGELAHDMTRVCLKDAGHEGEHGDKDWPINLLEAPMQQIAPKLDAVGLMDALDLPEEMKDVQDCYWQARREWTELQHAYLTVIEHMAKVLIPDVE